MLTDFQNGGPGSVAYDALLNPRSVFAIPPVSVPADGQQHEVLPAAPAGYFWNVIGFYSNQNVGTAAITLRQFTPAGVAQIVDQRTMPAGPTFNSGTTLGSLATRSRLTLQVATGPVVFSGTAQLIPEALVRLYWFSLTAVEQSIDTSTIPEGMVLLTNAPIFGMAAPGGWTLNTGATRFITARFVRGGVTSYNSSTNTSLGTRVGNPPVTPALLRGDTLALALSAAPSAPFYLGLAYLLVPQTGV